LRSIHPHGELPPLLHLGRHPEDLLLDDAFDIDDLLDGPFDDLDHLDGDLDPSIDRHLHPVDEESLDRNLDPPFEDEGLGDTRREKHSAEMEA
jgi:hypothetical protein